MCVEQYCPFVTLIPLYKTCLFKTHTSPTLYSIIVPLDTLKIHVFENIMENGAFALLEQMLHFP